MDKGIEAIVAVMTAVVGVAMMAVLVSNNAQTGSIISSAGTAFSGIIKAAVSPVTGSSSISV